jgi:sugar phosphate isomerase/epimerase
MFRFGIMAMQAELLTQQAMGRGQKVTPRADPVDLVRRLADAGFGLIELNPDLMVFFPNALDLSAIQGLNALRESRGIHYTIHLPLWSLEPSTPVQHVRRASVDVLVEAVLLTAPLEPEIYVLHATGALASEFSRAAIPGPVRSQLMGLFNAQARRSVEELLERTGLSPRQLAIETIEFPFELTLELAQTLDLPICLDAGHMLAGCCGSISVDEALDQVLPRLAEVHLHDGYRRPSPDGRPLIADHLALGEGDLPLERVLDTLDRAGFAGPIILEMTIEQARQSLGAVRRLRPDLVAS